MTLPTNVQLRAPAVAVLAGVAVAASSLGLVPSASAASRIVQMGPPPSLEQRLQRHSSTVNAFFPSTLVIRAGDTVQFVERGFHTVDLPARGGTRLPFIVPTREEAQDRDEAGRQFWFRNTPIPIVNRLLRTPSSRNPSYSGSRRVIGGLAASNDFKRLTVRFTRPGVYKYFCDVHHDMTGTIRVRARTAGVPSTADDARAVARQGRAALKTAVALSTRKATPGVVRVGRAGAGGVERLTFGPRKVVVTQGQLLRFAVSNGSREQHTATTGPGDTRDPDSYLGKLLKSFEGPKVGPVAAFASDSPTLGPVSLRPSLHGNGFWNTGVMVGFRTRTPPVENRIRFARTGTFKFFCLIHPSMRMTVTVRRSQR